MTMASAKTVPSIAIRPAVPHHIRLRWLKPKLGSVAHVERSAGRDRVAAGPRRASGRRPNRSPRSWRLLQGQVRRGSRVGAARTSRERMPTRTEPHTTAHGVKIEPMKKHRRRERADERPDRRLGKRLARSRAAHRARSSRAPRGCRRQAGDMAGDPAAAPRAGRGGDRPGSLRSCRRAAARPSPTRACRRPTDRRRRRAPCARLRTTLTTNSSTLTAMISGADRRESGSGRPSPSRRRRCRRAAACRAGRAGASGRR